MSTQPINRNVWRIGPHPPVELFMFWANEPECVRDQTPDADGAVALESLERITEALEIAYEKGDRSQIDVAIVVSAVMSLYSSTYMWATEALRMRELLRRERER